MRKVDRVQVTINLEQRQFPKLDLSAKQIVGRIVCLDNVFSRDFDRLLAGSGIGRTEFGVLTVLRAQGPPYTLAPNVINQLRFNPVTSGGMTNILHGLQERGLVERLPDPTDGRGVLIRLTPQALDTIDRAFEARVALEHRWLAGLNGKERSVLEVLVRKLLISLDPYALPVTQHARATARIRSKKNRA